jgi:hypothetical protein
MLSIKKETKTASTAPVEKEVEVKTVTSSAKSHVGSLVIDITIAVFCFGAKVVGDMFRKD